MHIMYLIFQRIEIETEKREKKSLRRKRLFDENHAANLIHVVCVLIFLKK